MDNYVRRFTRYGLTPSNLPNKLFGEVSHTHKAINDAVGYANLPVNLIRIRSVGSPQKAADRRS